MATPKRSCTCLLWPEAGPTASGRLVGLGVITAVAFLFRHDHGVYIGLFAVTLLVATHWSEPRQSLTAVGRYAVVTTLCLLPYGIFIQATTGLTAYVQEVWGPGRRVIDLRINPLPFNVDFSALLLRMNPPSQRRVNVRWAADLDDTVRRELATTYGLSDPVQVEGTTWSYVPNDVGSETLTALIGDPVVEDTSGVDRQTATLVQERLWTRMTRRLPVLRMQLLPGVATEGNALASLYYLFLLVPVACVVTLLVCLRRGLLSPAETAWSIAATLLLAVALQTLVRGSPDSRLPDVAGLVVALASWAAGHWLAGGGPGWTTGTRWTAAGVLWLSVAWAAAIFGALPGKVDKLGVLSGLGEANDRLTQRIDGDRLRPMDTWHYDHGLGALTRWAQTCTAPTDRLFVTWFAPEVFFFAERAFAGGQVYLHPGWHSSPADQRLTLERLRRQRVPIALSLADDDAFPRQFPLVFEHVMRRYRVVAESTFGGQLSYAVRVDRQLSPTRIHDPLGLPCYR